MVSALSDVESPFHTRQEEDGGEDDGKSDVSSLHEDERRALAKFDFDTWGGETGANKY